MCASSVVLDVGVGVRWLAGGQTFPPDLDRSACLACLPTQCEYLLLQQVLGPLAAALQVRLLLLLLLLLLLAKIGLLCSVQIDRSEMYAIY